MSLESEKNDENITISLNYKPIIASSIDSNLGNINEISKKLNESKGWFSSRFCNYPQSIYIQFNYPVHLNQINLCMHEKIIPEKIYFFSYFPEDIYGYKIQNYQNLNYNNFGFVKLDDNSKSDFKFREYRKIFVDINALVVRLDFEKNYFNKFNTFQQVGLISAEFLGRRIKGGLNINIDNILNKYNNNNNNNEENEEIDPSAKDKLNYFNEKLTQAMKEKNYKECKDIKDNIDQITFLGTEIFKLNKDKINAVYIEDFDSAQKLKEKVEKLRSQLDLIGTKKAIDINNNISSEENNNNEDDNNNIIDYSINNDNNKSNVIKPVVQFNEDDFKPYDEIVIPTLRKKNNSSFDLKKEYNLDDNGNDNDNSNNNNIKEFEKEIIKKYSLLIPFVGEESIKNLFSNSPKKKEEGFNTLKDKLSEIFIDKNLNKILLNLFDLVSYIIEDKNSNVILNTYDFIHDLFDYILINNEKINPSKNLNYFLYDRIINQIIQKLGDSKLSPKAIEMFNFFLKQKIYDYKLLISHLIAPDVKIDEGLPYKINNKLTMSKLLILQNILESFNQALEDKLITLESFPSTIIKKFILMNIVNSRSEIRKLSRLLISKYIEIFNVKSISKEIISIDPRELNKLKEEIPQLKEYLDKTNINKVDISNQNKSKISNNQTSNNVSNINKSNKKTNKTKNIISKSKSKEKIKKEKEREKCVYCQNTLNPKISMEKHFEKYCPMFTNCPRCSINIEVKRLTNHCLYDCKFKKDFMLCKRCKEAIPIKLYDKHQKENRCNPAKNMNSNNRCPLCHEDIPPYDKGFFTHLCVDFCDEQIRSHKKKDAAV